MPFFKTRKPGSEGAANVQTESIETLRRRAKHRLIGAVVLVVAAVIGFPILFETQPRPVPVNVAIDIPDKNKVPPLRLPDPGKSDKAASSPAPAAAPPSRVSTASSLGADEQVVPPSSPPPVVAMASPKVEARPSAPLPESKPQPQAQPRAEPKPEPEPKPRPKPEPKPESKAEPKPAPTRDDAARARALLEGRDPDKAASKPTADAAGRFIVQIGAFEDTARAQEVRQKVERGGLKTYTHVAETPSGKRTRVRVGPYGSRAAAGEAASRIKALGLPAAILTL